MSATDQDGPWVGARPFGTDDESRFFGRTREIHELADLWLANRLTLLVGDNGVGKTSLLHAGVLPLLRDAGAHVLPIGDLRYRQTMPAPLIPARSPDLFSLLMSWQKSPDPARCVGLTIRDFLRKQARNDASGRPEPTLVAIDGVERVLRGTGSDARRNRRFLAELTDALKNRPEVHLLLSVRPEYAEDALRLAEVLEEGAAPVRFELPPLDRVSAIEAATKPLGRGSVTFGEGVAAQLVDALLAEPVAGAGCEPGVSYVEPLLLQVLCTDLWDRLRAAGTTTVTISGDMVADVDGVLADFCTRTLGVLTSDHDLPTCEIGTWMRQTFVAPSGTARHAPQTGHSFSETVVRAVEDRHLIKFCLMDGVAGYQLQHPRLAGALQRLGEAPVTDEEPAPPDLVRDAELAMTAGDRRLARRYAQAAIKSATPGHTRARVSAHLILGDIAYAEAMPDTAIGAYEDAIGLLPPAGGSRSPELGRVFAAVARLWLRKGDPAKALEKARSAMLLGADEILAKLELGQAQWHAHRRKQALEELDHILRREPRHVEALRIRGEMYADLGDARALDDLDKIIVAAPPSARAAWVLAARAGASLTEPELEELLADAENDGLMLLTLARVMRHRGDRDTSEQLAMDALNATNPQLADYHRKEAEKLSRGR